MGDTNAVNAASGGTTNAPHGIGVTINVSGNAVIDGTLDASKQGFPGNITGGWSGPAGGNSNGEGGGYGGKSGKPEGALYGLVQQPTALGSGDYAYDSGGGGSGGSVWIICDVFQGGGTVSADAANANTAGMGAGGGGRVALEYSSSTFTGTVSVAGGTYDLDGLTGTYFLCQSPCPGTDALTSDFSVSSNDVKITRVATKWARYFKWSDTSTDVGSLITISNDVTYTLSVVSNKLYRIYVNDVDIIGATTNSGPSGTLSFDAILDPLSTMRVEPLPAGTIFFFY